MGKNFSVTLMGTVFLNCGAVMEKRIVKMAVMREAVMELFACVMKRQSFPARTQVQKNK